MLAKQAMVDENAVKPVPYGTVQEHCRDRRIHAAAEAEDDLVVTEHRAEFIHGTLHEGVGSPFAATAADPDDEILQKLCPMERMHDFRMELYAPDRSVGALESRIFHAVRRGGNAVSFGQCRDSVTVAHPDL